jgi:OCT family organic cation transporter-like MFS transporter 4/5
MRAASQQRRSGSLPCACSSSLHPVPCRRRLPPRQLADRFGRKACLFAAAALSALFPALGTACTSYWPWLVTRVLSGVGAAGTALAAYILATEPIGDSWRGAMGIATQIAFIAGEFALVAAASAFPSWRGQAAATAAANAALLLLWPLLPESGRWLQCQGRMEEATKVRA